MDRRAYKSLVAAEACWVEIAREAGCDWRTAKKYLGARVTTRQRPVEVG
jgi:transposase